MEGCLKGYLNLARNGSLVSCRYNWVDECHILTMLCQTETTSWWIKQNVQGFSTHVEIISSKWFTSPKQIHRFSSGPQFTCCLFVLSNQSDISNDFIFVTWNNIRMSLLLCWWVLKRKESFWNTRKLSTVCVKVWELFGYS